MRILILLLFLSGAAFGDPVERKTKRAKRQLERRLTPYDERDRAQRRRDRAALILLVVGAGLIVKTMQHD